VGDATSRSRIKTREARQRIINILSWNIACARNESNGGRGWVCIKVKITMVCGKKLTASLPGISEGGREGPSASSRLKFSKVNKRVSQASRKGGGDRGVKKKRPERKVRGVEGKGCSAFRSMLEGYYGKVKKDIGLSKPPERIKCKGQQMTCP